MRLTQEKWKQLGFALSALAFVFIVAAILVILNPALLPLHFIWPTLVGFALMGGATYAIHKSGKPS